MHSRVNCIHMRKIFLGGERVRGADWTNRELSVHIVWIITNYRVFFFSSFHRKSCFPSSAYIKI